MEQCCIALGMPECVNIPTDSWGHSEFFAEPLMSLHKVLNDILKVCIALISMYPASHNDLKPSLFDQLFKTFLHFFRLSNIPHVQELHLNKSELSSGVSLEFKYYFREDLLHSSVCSPLLHSAVVLLVGLLPSNIVMGMCHHVHCQVLMLVLPRLHWGKHHMGILLTGVVHVDDFHLASNVVVIFFFVRLDSSEHVDGVNLIFSEVHHTILISGIA